MSATPSFHATLRRRPSFSLVVCLLVATAACADDRFFVPVGPSESSPPPSPPPSSGGGSSGSSGGSSGGDSGSSTNNSGGSSGGRFFVPMPGEPSPGGGNGNPGGGGGSGGFYDPYWGGCYYAGGRYHYWNSPGSWDFGYPYFGYPQVQVRYRYPFEMRGPIVFFPPEAPPLGSPLPEPPPFAPGRTEAPAALQEFITAPFYPQLSSRLLRGNLNKRQLQEVDTYRGTRRALLEELRAKLESTRLLPTAARTQALQEFATTQKQRLLQLEASSDRLRTDLLRGGLLGAVGESGDWNRGRTWRLGSPYVGSTREQTLGLEFRVMRAAAFYQEGLSPAQRELLREVAAELQADAYRPRGAAAMPYTGDELVTFSPATARVRFSEDLPQSITAKIQAFTTERAALKSELRDVIYTRDSESRSARTSALRKLAAAQAPRIAALDVLAEEIRMDIAALGRPLRPAPLASLPPELASRVENYRTRRAGLQQQLNGELALAAKTVVTSNTEAEAMLRDTFANFREAHHAAHEELDTARAALRTELAAYYARDSRTVSAVSIDAVLNATSAAQEPDVLWQRYADYADAVLLPGLSREQRQLLFDGALEQLNLPLPDGERMP